MMKQKIIGMALIFTTFASVIFGANQYFEKQRYEKYLSIQISNNI